jgi:Spy/CpxP family protein refolding chaperone
MKKVLICSLIVLGVSSASFAHCGGCGTGDDHKSESKTETSKKHTHNKISVTDLKLTEKQMKKYEKINSEYEKELTELNEEFKEDIMEILNDEQKEIYNNNNMRCSVCSLEKE